MSRLPHALVAALALHGLFLLVHARHVTERAQPLARTRAPELVEIEAPEVEALPEPGSAASNAQSVSAGVSAHSAVAARIALASPSAAASADNAASAAANPDGSADAPSVPQAAASAEAPARKIDLGLDGQFFMRPPPSDLPRVHKSEIQRQLEASIAADDVKHGLARGNVFLGPLSAAVREAGPTRGEALLRVTVGPDGALTDLEFLRGSAADWTNALSSFREIASRKRARVPPGARGLRVTFSVKAKVQLPSGAEIKGIDIAAPSLEPNGLVPHGTFDLADIGSAPQRLVYAHVVSEEVL